MADEWVIDASVVAKIFYTEDGSDRARLAAQSAQRLIAPDLLLLEIASVTRNYVRSEQVALQYGRTVIDDLPELVDELVSVRDLAVRALELSVEHGVSVYDATYVALAESSGLTLLTADEKLVRKCEAAGLGARVQAL